MQTTFTPWPWPWYITYLRPLYFHIAPKPANQPYLQFIEFAMAMHEIFASSPPFLFLCPLVFWGVAAVVSWPWFAWEICRYKRVGVSRLKGLGEGLTRGVKGGWGARDRVFPMINWRKGEWSCLENVLLSFWGSSPLSLSGNTIFCILCCDIISKVALFHIVLTKSNAVIWYWAKTINVLMQQYQFDSSLSQQHAINTPKLLLSDAIKHDYHFKFNNRLAHQ